MLNEQAALMAQESGLRQLFSFTKGEEFVEVQGSIVVRDALLESDPLLVEKFTRATLKGALYLKDNRAGSVAIHARVLKVNETVAGRIYDLARPGVTADGTVSEDVQKKAIEQIVERTDIKSCPRSEKSLTLASPAKPMQDSRPAGGKLRNGGSTKWKRR